MRKYNSIFYLLFILLVMGTFASMAQNSYGVKIMGGVAFVFALVFLTEFVTGLRKKNEERNGYAIIESATLFMLSVLFGFRVFYIHFPFIEFVFGSVAILLALVYLVEMITRYRHFQAKNKFLSLLIVAYHLSIIFFLSSLALVPFTPAIAQGIGVAALVLLLIFIAAGILGKSSMVDGEHVSVFRIVRRFKGHSIIIISLFLLFSLYVGFNRVGVLPDIYSDELPRAYSKLESASRKERTTDGKYKHEEFMEKYQEFLKHRKDKGK